MTDRRSDYRAMLLFVISMLILAATAFAQNAQDNPSRNSAVPDDETIYTPGRNGVTIPRAIKQTPPQYSDEARRKKLEGTVLLSLVVTANGDTADIKVTRALGSGLDEKAIEAVSQWKFEPATKDGKPVAVKVAVEVSFHLYK
jgi:TonB family protein